MDFEDFTGIMDMEDIFTDRLSSVCFFTYGRLISMFIFTYFTTIG